MKALLPTETQLNLLTNRENGPIIEGDRREMRLGWAKRVTTCVWCKADIKIGEPKVTDFFRTGYGMMRVHYHKNCYIQRIEHFFTKHPPERPRPSRKPLGLTREQMAERKRIMSALAYIQKTRTPLIARVQTSLATQGQHTIPSQEMMDYLAVRERIVHLIRRLQNLGGIPKRWLHFSEHARDNHHDYILPKTQEGGGNGLEVSTQTP